MEFRREGRRLEARHHKNPETARLKAAIERIIQAPTGDPGLPTQSGRLRQLERIIATEPQRDENGRLRYLVTSGLAVEMLTGFEREHHDIDLVIMDSSDPGHWEVIGTDNVTPGKYWADMRFDPSFLESTARTVNTRQRGRSQSVEVVHPGIIMVQKSSDAWGRSPRTKDRNDAVALARHWKEREGYTHDWNSIVRTALDALPGDQKDRTLTRVREIIN